MDENQENTRKSSDNQTSNLTKMKTRSSTNQKMETRSSTKKNSETPEKKATKTKNTQPKKQKNSKEQSKPDNKTKSQKSKTEKSNSKERKPTKEKKTKQKINAKDKNDQIEPIEFHPKTQQSQNTKDDSAKSLASIMPSDLKVYVSQEIWNSWSNIRRDSFKSIIKNPNSFFYRNRPPGEPQKYGPFTPSEEKVFIQRIKYFREELGIKDGLWGYFAVPLEGRVGYQCSNYYRKMIQEGKIRDNSYEVLPDGKLRYNYSGNKFNISKVPQNVLDKLQQEAFSFIKQCFDHAKVEGEIPQVLKPVNVKIEEPIESNSDMNDEGIFLDFGTPSQTPETGNYQFNHFAIKNGKQRTCFSAKLDEPLPKRSTMTLRNSTSSNGPIASRYASRNYTRSAANAHNFVCPLFGAIDPITNEIIERPMMDPLGIVLDRSTWKKIFSRQIIPPFEIAAFSMDNLIELNNYNYDEYRFYIVNFVC